MKLARVIKDPRFLLCYSPLQFGPLEIAKPDGSLSLTYLAGSLRDAGYAVRILDASVGNGKDDLNGTFFKTTQLPSGLIRCGMSRERIAEEIADCDVVGVCSIFTAQSKMVLDLIRIVKEVDPGKLVLAGGVNARNLRERFYRSGADVIATGEAESVILELARAVQGKCEIRDVRGIAYLDDRGKEVVTDPAPVELDLDRLPIPAWDLLPLDKYWEISRPHGGEFAEGEEIRYAALQTSRGCPFQCLYCHISQETEDRPSGAIGSFRMKSVDRVLREFETLKSLGARHVFFEDDSLLAKKKRALTLFRRLNDLGLQLSDVNGVNIVHMQKSEGGRLVVDKEFLEGMAEAGFKILHLPFESANQRILDKYSSSKWSIQNTDTEALIRSCRDLGIMVAGNYTIGYPDETVGEIHNTVLMAKRHVEQGLNHAGIYSIVPFPGTVLYEMVIASGQLPGDFDTDMMKWTRSMLINTPVPAESLEYMRQMAWLLVNRTEYVHHKVGQRVTPPAAATPMRVQHAADREARA